MSELDCLYAIVFLLACLVGVEIGRAFSFWKW